MAWPPLLPALKSDLKITDERDDAVLTVQLSAAVAFVERVRDGQVNFLATPGSPLPLPDSALELGTIRLAGRWHTRRRSPDGLVSSGDLGTSRVGTGDADIDKMLRVGRFALPVIA